jgi:hypothetical protein
MWLFIPFQLCSSNSNLKMTGTRYQWFSCMYFYPQVPDIEKWFEYFSNISLSMKSCFIKYRSIGTVCASSTQYAACILVAKGQMR